MSEAIENLAVELDFEDILNDAVGAAVKAEVKAEAKKEALEVLKVEAKTPVVNKAQMAQDAVKKLNQIGRELAMSNFEREDVIRSIQLGLATGKHVLLLGPPGTAKSQLAEGFASHIINANYFQWLLSRTSDPSELLGPISIKAMENDKFLRKPDGKLPQAHIAFIDEVYKGNSATLNTMLPALNERVWYNDGQRLPINLKLAIGASNEFPEDDEGLEAFHDRFVFRHWVEYIGDAGNQFQMLKRSAELRNGSIKPSNTMITLEEIEALQEQVDKVIVTDATINAFQQLIHELRVKKAINMSDRRLNACVHIMMANAALEGRTQTDPDDMEHLAYVLWEKRDDIETIQEIITKMMNPFKDKVNKDYRQAVQTRDEVMAITDKTDRANKAIDARTIIEKIVKRIDGVIVQAKKEGRDTTEFEAKKTEVAEMVNEIVQKCLFNIDDVFSSDSDELPF